MFPNKLCALYQFILTCANKESMLLLLLYFIIIIIIIIINAYDNHNTHTLSPPHVGAPGVEDTNVKILLRIEKQGHKLIIPADTICINTR